MKKRRRYNIFALSSLYLDFILKKSTYIIIGISLIVMSVGIFISSNVWMDKIDYMVSPNDFHLMYMRQVIFLTQIFNSVIITAIIVSSILQSATFDMLYLSYIPRRLICFCKVMGIFLILLFLSLFEMLVILGVGFFRYSYFVVSLDMVFSVAYLFMSMLFEAMVSIVCTTLCGVIFTPMLVLFCSILIHLLCNNYVVFEEKVSMFLPILKFDLEEEVLKIESPILLILWITCLFILYIQIYSVKDITTS